MGMFVLLKLISFVNSLFAVCVNGEQTNLIDLSLDDTIKEISENLNDGSNVLISNDVNDGCFCRYFYSTDWTYCSDENKCTNFPSDLRVSSKILTISTSDLKVLKKKSLVNNKQLIVIRLEDNVNLITIESGAFYGLNNLVNLSISYNKNLFSLENDTFTRLTNLTYLKLYNNGFNEFKDFVYSLSNKNLGNLKTLKIGQMEISELYEETFKNLEDTNIENLFLVTCMLRRIHPKGLAYFKNLKVLNLAENLLLEDNVIEVIKYMNDNGINVTVLSLENVSFKSFPIDLLIEIGKTKITQLGLNNLKFEYLQKFPNMPNLNILNLNNVLAFKVDNKTFNNLINLKQLFMQSNNLYNFPREIKLPNLEVFDISNSGKYFLLQKYHLEGTPNLTLLNLSFNIIRVLDKQLFTGVNKLETLILRNIKLNLIKNFTFSQTINLINLDLGGNSHFIASLEKFAFKGLNKLEFLYLDECKIDSLSNITYIFDDLKSLTHLNLKGNSINFFPLAMVERLNKLKVLDISFNHFIAYEYSFFEKFQHFKSLKITNNKLEYFTTGMINDLLNVESIDFKGNSFICNCKNLKTIGLAYFENPLIFMESVKDSHVYCHYPEQYRNQTLCDFAKKIKKDILKNCINEINQNVIIFSFLTVFILLFVSSITVTYIYRFEIRYYIFIIKIFLTNKTSTFSLNQTCNYYIYDAFVSYCNEDSEFVTNLVKNLENNHPYLKLCVYERDFEIGTVISESVLEHVAKSRKTMLIVSESFIKSQWCRWEVQVAENHTIFFENDLGNFSTDTVIIVKIGKIDTKNISPMLKYLMKTRVYLEWEDDEKKQKIFWNKLRNTLGSSKVICKA